MVKKPLLTSGFLFICLLYCLFLAFKPAYAQQQIGLTDLSPKLQPQANLNGLFEGDFGAISTELSPASLLHSQQNSINLFTNTEEWLLGPPSYCALSHQGQNKIISQGQSISGSLDKPWLVCWFYGSYNWNDWDAPIHIALQHQPNNIVLTNQALKIDFAGQAGMLTLTPLYGYSKIPFNQGSDYLLNNGLPSLNIYTQDWSNGLPAKVIARADYLTQVLRRYPVYVEEKLALDGEDLVVQSDFDWIPINDDWGTQSIRLAPLPPTLALAYWSHQNDFAKNSFPMSFSGPVKDLEMFTAYGPYMGIEGVDRYQVRFSTMKYVQQINEYQVQFNKHSSVQEVYDKLQQAMARKFRSDSWGVIWDHGGEDNYCWQIQGDDWYGQAAPFIESEQTKTNMRKVIRDYLNNYVLVEANYEPYKGMLLLTGPGIGYRPPDTGDAGKFASNILETLWSFAYYTDSWDIIEQNWGMIKKLFVTPWEGDWKAFGRYAIAEMGDEGGPPLAMARMAYLVGDYDTYAFASYIFTRELVHHYVKQVGHHYFRLNQPYHSLEFMPEEVYLTNMWGGLYGWQLDGPAYKGGQYTNRWIRFASDEVGSFYHDVLFDETKAELDHLTSAAQNNPDNPYKYRLETGEAHISPSLITLRALLLHEGPEQLAGLADPDTWVPQRGSDKSAMMVPFLKQSSLKTKVQLIPNDIKTNFVLGLERTRPGSEYPALVFNHEAAVNSGPMAGFPHFFWMSWRAPKMTPLKNGAFWSFGAVKAPEITINELEFPHLNWNTRARFFGTPDKPINLISNNPLPYDQESDLNGDGQVNVFDLVIVGGAFGKGPGEQGYDARADANQSGGPIDILDLVLVGNAFGNN